MTVEEAKAKIFRWLCSRYHHLFHVSQAMVALFILLCGATTQTDILNTQYNAGIGPSEKIQLPQPFATPSVSNASKVIGWPKGRMPMPLPGFEVNLFAEDFDNPRLAYLLPNQDILVVEVGGGFRDRITLFRDTDKDGKPDVREVFLTGLNRPHGVLLIGNWFYVGNTDGVVRYPYRSGQTKIDGKGEKILNLPAGGHYTRNLIADATSQKIYVAVGSQSNVDEGGMDARDVRRAAILQGNPDGSGTRVFASGLRNPVGMDWEPKTNILRTVVNERDGLGDDLVPD